MKAREPLIYDVTPERDTTDLEMCIMALRNLSRIYPRHFDIAYEALRREYNLPIMQIVEKEKTA